MLGWVGTVALPGLYPAVRRATNNLSVLLSQILWQECVGINLANQTGREGKLSAAYAAAAREYAAGGGSGFRLEPFDFHKQCGATNYARLGLLWEVGGVGCWVDRGE